MHQPRSTQTQNQRVGFTLTELLIVIGIVALLAAILFPVFAKARNGAVPLFSCQSNLKMISQALDQYMADHDDLYPDAFNDTGLAPCPSYGCEYYLPPAGAPDPRHTWETSILPYLTNEAYLACPHDALAGPRGILNGPTSYNTYKGYPDSYAANGYVACYTAAEQYSGCYCRGVMCQTTIGYYVPGNGFIPGKRGPNMSANSGIELFDVHHPETTVAVSEVFNADALPADNGGSSNPNGNNGHFTNWATWHAIGGQHNPCANYGYRVSQQLPNLTNPTAAGFGCDTNGAVSTHHGSQGTFANFLYCDGHVAALIPTTTNPTPDAGNPSLPNGDTYDPDNQWDATRP